MKFFFLVVFLFLQVGCSYNIPANRGATTRNLVSRLYGSKLIGVKERAIGRDDLATMAEENSEESFQSFMEAGEETMKPPVAGDKVTGTVVEWDDLGAFIDISGKMCGYLPLKEASLEPIKHVKEAVEIGQEITAEILGTLRGMPVFSLRSAQLVNAWDDILAKKEEDTSFSVKIVEVNKGGAMCYAFGLKAFLPGSHCVGMPTEDLVGKSIDVKFLDVNPEEGKVVVSQRLATPQIQLQSGQVVEGTVTGLRKYGVFLEITGGYAGLLHISQISYDRVTDLEKLFSIGQKAKVMVMEHDESSGRVALSTKTLERTPGEMFKDMDAVFANAEATAKAFQEKAEQERSAREAAAADIVAGLSASGEDTGLGKGSELENVADSIENILSSIVDSADE